MRFMFALSLLLAAFATQASGQTAPSISIQFGGAHAQSTIGSEPTKAASTADDEHHDGSEDQTHHECASVGHCAASAIGASNFLFKTDYYSAVKPAVLNQSEVGSGFTLPPYRPPARAS